MNRMIEQALPSEHKSITAYTYERLRDAIITAQFRPGEKLRIDSIKEEFKASLGAVREALAALTSEGLVTAEPQRGFTVALISRADLVDLTEVRVRVETICLEEAIEHGDLAWEGRILSVTHQLSKLTYALSSDPTSSAANDWHRLHERFHHEIASACPNSWWLKLRKQLYTQSERYRRLSGSTSSYNRDINIEHEQIASAAVAHDAKEAKELLAKHLYRTTDILLKSHTVFSNNQE